MMDVLQIVLMAERYSRLAQASVGAISSLVDVLAQGQSGNITQEDCDKEIKRIDDAIKLASDNDWARLRSG